jgi:hypothetical protein
VFNGGQSKNLHNTENGSFSTSHTNRGFQPLLSYTRNKPLKSYRFRGLVILHCLYVRLFCLHVRLYRLFVYQHRHEIISHHGDVKLHRVSVILHRLNVFKLYRYVNKHSGVVCLHRRKNDYLCLHVCLTCLGNDCPHRDGCCLCLNVIKLPRWYNRPAGIDCLLLDEVSQCYRNVCRQYDDDSLHYGNVVRIPHNVIDHHTVGAI